MRTIKLTIEYDGTHFSGWQIQPNQRTVQGVIEKALAKLTKEKIKVVGAGRTDAGVHALGQVASFRCQKGLPMKAFINGINFFLPEDVKIIHAEEAHPSFNARRDAVQRTYRYVVSKRPRVVGRYYSWYSKMTFSLEPMKKASHYLVGGHDFTSFSKSDSETNDYSSHVLDIHWIESDEEVWFEITALRFFHNMVRIIMGSLLEVGYGRISPEQFHRILMARDRKVAGPTLPPQGLFLVSVGFDQ